MFISFIMIFISLPFSSFGVKSKVKNRGKVIDEKLDPFKEEYFFRRQVLILLLPPNPYYPYPYRYGVGGYPLGGLGAASPFGIRPPMAFNPGSGFNTFPGGFTGGFNNGFNTGFRNNFGTGTGFGTGGNFGSGGFAFSPQASNNDILDPNFTSSISQQYRSSSDVIGDDQPLTSRSVRADSAGWMTTSALKQQPKEFAEDGNQFPANSPKNNAT